MGALKLQLSEWLSQQHSSFWIISLLTCFLLPYASFIVAYRLFFSPIARFPGPKLAAATDIYEFYYNWWCQGKYVFEIEKMHQKYGPIVRINPRMLHIKDSSFYNEIYVTEGKRKTNGYLAVGAGLGFDDTHFLTADHDHHRRRRRPLESYFSRSGILRLQPVLEETVEKLNNRLEQAKRTGSVICLDHAFFAMIGDVISKLCWAEKEDYLGDPAFAPEWYNLVHTLIKYIYLFQMFPWFGKIMVRLPEWIVTRLAPQARVFSEFHAMTLKNVSLAKREKLDKQKRDPFRRHYPSLFHWIVNSDMPESEQSDERLANEAQVLQSAGTTSTARSLTHITYNVLANERIRLLLQEEVSGVMSYWPYKVPTWVDLEGLQYLQAVLNEGLRHNYATMHPLPRISPHLDIQYKEWTIPAGTIVGMSSMFMHTDSTIYPEPEKFLPERWLGDVNPDMMRNFVPFARGSRNCLGQNLARAELSLALAVLFRPGAPQMRLFETDETNTNHVHDYVVPLPKLGGLGVRVTVH